MPAREKTIGGTDDYRVTPVALSDARSFALARKDGRHGACLLDLRAGTCGEMFAPQTGRATGGAVSDDGRILAIVNDAGGIEVWDAAARTRLHSLSRPAHERARVAVSRRGTYVAIIGGK